MYDDHFISLFDSQPIKTSPCAYCKCVQVGNLYKCIRGPYGYTCRVIDASTDLDLMSPRVLLALLRIVPGAYCDVLPRLVKSPELDMVPRELLIDAMNDGLFHPEIAHRMHYSDALNRAAYLYCADVNEGKWLIFLPDCQSALDLLCRKRLTSLAANMIMQGVRPTRLAAQTAILFGDAKLTELTKGVLSAQEEEKLKSKAQVKYAN